MNTEIIGRESLIGVTAPVHIKWNVLGGVQVGTRRASLAGGNMEDFRLISILLILVSLGGCASSLRCGTDGDSSYVDVVNIREIPSAGRYYAELCSFAYEAPPKAEITILEEAL